MNQKDFFLRTYPFLLVFFVFAFFGMGMLAYHGKDTLHLEYNQIHHPWLDWFFKYYTDIGTTGTLLVILWILLKQHSWRMLLHLAVPYFILTVGSTIIKRIFFIHVHRPTYYFDQKKIDLHLVEGVSSQIPFTFPSGHSMNAFLFFLFLCLLFKNKWLQLCFALLACAVAISRVYLSKHFVLDTVAGSFMGVFGLMFCYYWIGSWQHPKWLDKKIMQTKPK